LVCSPRLLKLERFHDLVQIDVADGHGRPLVSLLRGQPRQFPSRQESLERHPLVRRSFRFRRIPTWFLVAPRGEFNPQALCAFLAHAGQGVNYAKGVWHHSLVALWEVSDGEFNALVPSAQQTRLQKIHRSCPRRSCSHRNPRMDPRVCTGANS